MPDYPRRSGGFFFPGSKTQPPPTPALPNEALDYFRQKGLRPGFSFEDVWQQEHATAFTVAKAMELDVMQNIQEALKEAIDEGLTFPEFAKRLTPKLQEKGWWGHKLMVDPATNEERIVEVGTPRRLKTIFQINMRTARAAGQWERIQQSKDILPYLLYTVGPSREHRPEHLDWHGTLLPVDDPWWATHAVPNGWGCKCRIRQVSRWEYDRMVRGGIQAPPSEQTAIRDEQGNLTGRHRMQFVPVKTIAPPSVEQEYINKRTGEVTRVPVGIDPGWDYNPGEVSRQQRAEQILQEKLRALNSQTYQSL